MLENSFLNETDQKRKPKINELLNKIKKAKTAVEVQNSMNEFGNFTIKSNGSNAYYILGINGGTRKRKTTQRKRAKTLKNKKKVGKRK